MQKELYFSSTKREEIINITQEIKKIVKESGVKEGICVIYACHTTAAITINENDDSKIRDDILNFFKQAVPRGSWEHDKSGKCDRQNADAHIKSSMVGSNQILMIADGELILGVWQDIFLCEFDGPRKRKILVKIIKG